MDKQRTLCLFCSLSSFTTGMPISTSKLIGHFAAGGYRPVLAVFPGEGELTRRAREMGATVVVIPFSRFRLVSIGGLARAVVAFVPAFVKLLAALRRNRIALVHFSDFIDAPFYPAARLSGARCVAHLRMSIEKRWMRVLYRLWTALWVDRVVCISRAVERYAGLRPAKTTVVYNPGPDRRLFDPDRVTAPATSLRRDCRRVVTIADFREVKGHEHFVEMARRVEEAAPGSAQFVIVGGPVPSHERYHEAIMHRIRELDLQDRFVATGKIRHEEVAAVLAGACVLVHLPNYQEGFGGVILEAMMMRVPVVVFDSGGVGECFTHGVAGYIVPQFDVAQAASHVIALVTDRELQERMAAAARAEVLERFSHERHFAGIERIYRELAGA